MMSVATVLVVMTNMEVATMAVSHIPTTLDGPFDPVTRRFDPSLRRGSDDLPMTHPRLRRNVTSNSPEQIALAISSPTSMWVSWVTGSYFHYFYLLPQFRVSIKIVSFLCFMVF